MQALSAPAPHTTLFGVLSCLPMAPALPIESNGQLRCVPVFWQLSDKPLLARRVRYGVLRVDNNEASVK